MATKDTSLLNESALNESVVYHVLATEDHSRSPKVRAQSPPIIRVLEGSPPQFRKHRSEKKSNEQTLNGVPSDVHDEARDVGEQSSSEQAVKTIMNGSPAQVRSKVMDSNGVKGSKVTEEGAVKGSEVMDSNGVKGSKVTEEGAAVAKRKLSGHSRSKSAGYRGMCMTVCVCVCVCAK